MKLHHLFIALCLSCAFVACNDDDDIQVPTNVVPTQTGEFVDERDQNTYQWVRIGNLEWSVENLRYDLPDDTKQLYYIDYNTYYEYTYEDKYSGRFGCLYTLSGALEAIPEGWRLPTDDDWKALEEALGMSKAESASRDWRGSVEGSMMQQAVQGTAFDLLLAGYYSPYISVLMSPPYRYLGAFGFYWTSTSDADKEGEYYFYRKISCTQAGVYRESMEPEAAMLSVRFVRDAQ